MNKEKSIIKCVCGNRFKILKNFIDSGKKELTPKYLSSYLGMKYSALSHILKQMRDIGILLCEKRGSCIYYRINEKIYEEIQSIKENFEKIFTKM